MTDVLVIGAGPAGVLAALRAADLGAQTALVTSGAFVGGMTANDGPVPVRTLPHAGRCQSKRACHDYSRLLARVREVDSVALNSAHEPGLAIGWQGHQAA